MSTKYTYSIQNDFPNHKVDTSKLIYEVRSSEIVTAVDYINTSGDDCDIWFKASLSSGDETILDGIVAAHDGEPLPSDQATLITTKSCDPDGTIKTVEESRSDYRTTIMVHNFANPCTWYQKSSRITDEVLTPNDDRTVFSSAHSCWIDLSHGKVSDEDEVSAGYLPVVKLDSVTKTEDAPFGDGGDGDFSINYRDGKVTFHSPVADGVNVTASYSHAVSSEFVFSAPAEKIIRILVAECQMTTDVVMNDTLSYGIYVGDTCVKSKKYKNIIDIINEVNGAYPVVPAFGGTKRGVPSDCVTFPWDFKSRTDLKGSLSMSVRIRLENNKPCDGSLATVTFYCVTLDEV